MLSGYHPVLQSLMGTLLTWGLTALGASLVLVFQGGQVSLDAVTTHVMYHTWYMYFTQCTYLTPIYGSAGFSPNVRRTWSMACSFSVSPQTVVRLCVCTCVTQGRLQMYTFFL